MPATTLPYVPHYEPPAPTQVALDYADLPIIDISDVNKAEVKASLAEQAYKAMTEHGFMYIVGHGYPEEKIQRIFDIANVPFEHTSEEEKRSYEGKVTTGSLQGYKLKKYWHIDNGVFDQIEHYAINRDVRKKEHPSSLRPMLPEIEAFAKFNHENVLHVVLRLLALGLGLPEEIFAELHGYSAVGESCVSFMKYYLYSKEDEEKARNVWLKGHTDTGSISILWNQPISALQMLTKDGQWKWVRHIPNALVIHAGDSLSFLSGGRYPATIHRVVRPPPDQASFDRLGVSYFAMFDDDVILKEVEGLKKQTGSASDGESDKPTPTMEQWRRARTVAYGKSSLTRAGNGVEEEQIQGVVVKHYN